MVNFSDESPCFYGKQAFSGIRDFLLRPQSAVSWRPVELIDVRV